MDGVEKNEKREEDTPLSGDISMDTKDILKAQETDKTSRPFEHLDSFEKLEAQLQASISFDETCPSSADKAESSFSEDYSMKDGTYLDTGKFSDPRTFDIIRDLETLERLRTLESENEIDLERKEVAALIKKAEEKLLPGDKDVETFEVLGEDTVGTATESQVIIPELVELEKCIASPDLLRMESSDVSEEGFRLRLSCIFEESESDSASMSGSIVKQATLPDNVQGPQMESPALLDNENGPRTECVMLLDNENGPRTECVMLPDSEKGPQTECAMLPDNENGPQRECAILPDNKQESRIIPPDTTQEPQISLPDTVQDPRITPLASLQEPHTTLPDNEQSLSHEIETQVNKAHDTIENTAPSNVDTDLPNINGDRGTISGLGDSQKDTSLTAIKKIELPITDLSDSDQNVSQETRKTSIDEGSIVGERIRKALEREDSIDTPSTSPEPKSFGIQKLKSGSNVDKLLTRPIIMKRLESSSDSSLDLSTTLSSQGPDYELCNIVELDAAEKRQESPTPEKVIIELDEHSEPLMSEVATIGITEMTEEDIDALFPKIKKGRRGKSLESGMAEKINEEREQQDKEEAKLETKSHKGDEERPPVPPETYLWEELRRWRMKGGYPWTYLDKPPFDEKTWKQMTDHEYEPINPPPQESTTERPRREDEEQLEERRFLRIPRDEELVLSPEDMEMEAIAAAQDLQDDLEGRFLATTPMTTTTASRTDCDVNTSMLDSSGLEDLPLKRGARTKKAIQDKTEQMRAQAQGIQQRLRSQAGKLRNKLRSIPRPSFQRKQERDKERSSPSEQPKSRFRLPDRPKLSLPDRPKFNFPDRPKFKMPQKPKLSLPHFSTAQKERQTHTLQHEPKKKMFDIDFKTYPRMFSKKSKERGDYATSSPKLQRSATPPPAPVQPARKKGPIGQRWVNRFDDIKFVDDKASEASRRSQSSESLSGFHDKDFAITEDIDQTRLPPARTLSTKSSLSHISDYREDIPSSRNSEDRPRGGVIEEIDSDQFFLRQKGISEEDIDMGKYLSEEIREAFKSPVVNALKQLDYDYEEDELRDANNKENVEPLPPTRTRSLKKPIRKDKSPVRKTPSPVPQKVSSSNQDTSTARYENLEPIVTVNKEVIKPSKARYENLGQSEPSRYENIEDGYDINEDDISEYYKSPPPPVEYQHYKVPKNVPTPTKRKSSASEQSANKKKHHGWVEVEVETSMEKVEVESIPQPLKRKKSKKNTDEKQEIVEGEKKRQDSTEADYIIPNEIPQPPRRYRSLSREARSSHSLAYEEEGKEPPPPAAPLRNRSLSRGARSTHSLAQEEDKVKSQVTTPEAPIRYRSLSRGARSTHSLAQEEERIKPIENLPEPPRRHRSFSHHTSQSVHSLSNDISEVKPTPPKRTTSKKSIQSLGCAPSPGPQEPERVVKRVNSQALSTHSLKGANSLSKIRKSHQSIAGDESTSAMPEKYQKTRSSSRGSHSYHSLGGDEDANWNIAEQDATRSLPYSRNNDLSLGAQIGKGHIYEAPSDGYAVIDKGGSKPKPPRPPPPRRKKGSQSPNFNTLPRRSPMRPVRAYATLGPSRPPRKSKPKPAKSVEHIYQSDQISQSYLEVSNALQPIHIDDIHGSNKDLQTDEVIEKMKGRPLPAPPRPPRLRARAEEASTEEVEEVCVSTQTDPLPDDLILEDDIMQELSHDDYQMQEAFLQAMREEDELIMRNIEERRAKQLAVEAEKAIEKEKTQLESERRQKEHRENTRTHGDSTSEGVPTRSNEQMSNDTELKKTQLHLEAEDDMGYASLDRRQTRVEEEPTASTSFQNRTEEEFPTTVVATPPTGPVYIPLVPEVINTDCLRVGNLEVDRLTVHELQATSIQVQDLRAQSLQANEFQGALLNIQEIQSQTGQLNVGNIELPADFLQQIIARIPWEELRAPQPLPQEQEVPVMRRQEQDQQQGTTAVRRRNRHLRQHSSRSQYSSDEEDTGRQTRRQLRTAPVDPNILELGQQLARACTNAGFRALREFAERVRVPEQEEDRAQFMKTVLCILFIAIAGYFLVLHHANDIHHHHWDFQFPPQPPKQ